MVQFMHLQPIMAAAAAILIVFLGRYLAVKTLVWRIKPYEHTKVA
jgi:ABC-type nickel/cobalt efflux system permease component RcnA